MTELHIPDGTDANEERRLAELDRLHILDSPEVLEFNQIVQQAADDCQTPIALISLVDKDRQWFKARVGLSVRETPREYAFCQHAIRTPDQVFVIPDARADQRFEKNPLVTGEPNIRFYAGAPIVTSTGHALGTLCVIDREPRQADPEQLSRLTRLAHRVAEMIETGSHTGGLEEIRDKALQTFSCEEQAKEREQDPRADIALLAEIPTLKNLMGLITDVSGLETVFVARLSGNQSLWTITAIEGVSHLNIRVGSQFPAKSSMLLASMAQSEPELIDDVREHPLYRDYLSPTNLLYRSYGACPIRLPDGQIFGALCAVDLAPKTLRPFCRAVFSRVARLVGQSIPTHESLDLARQRLRKEIEQRETRDRFVAILGHDLRTPIAAMVASAALLKRKVNDETVHRIADQIRGSSKRMAVMVDDVLDLARSQFSGGIQLREQLVDDLGAALLRVVEEVQEPISERLIFSSIKINAPVYCDQGRIQQLCSNLLANALTYGAAAGHITFLAEVEDQTLRIEVWNEGTPIPPERMSRIFDAFSRPSGSKPQDGLGLGLFICSEIVKAHNGTLTVRSNQQDGTTFTARFPIRRHESER